MTTTSELEHHTEFLLEGLHRELDDGRVEAIGQMHFERLLRQARVLDYIPLLVYRATKDDVLAFRRHH
jgi:hypothetical protein